MPASIVLTGIDSSVFRPGNFLEINFAKGQASGFQGIYAALLIGNMLASGSATADVKVYGADTDVPAGTEDEIITLFGAGSELHRMWKRFTAANRSTPLYLLPVPPSAGTAASLTVTFATTATGECFVRFWCVDEYVDVSIQTGDIPNDIATELTALVNAKTHWPITAAVTGTGVMTATAKHAGPRGNDIKVQANIFATSGTPGMTVTRTTATNLASGATADSNTTALTTIAAKRFRYIVSAANDSTQLGAVKTQVNSRALPASGMTQQVFAGFSGSLATCITLATGINAARAEIAWQKSSDWTPSELAAQEAAAVALFEAGQMPRPLKNFNGFGNSERTGSAWLLKAPRSGTGPTTVEIESALHNGITPIGANQNGTSFIIKRATTRSLNGAVPDYRISEPHKVMLLDFWADDLKTALDTATEGKDVGDDPPSGTAPDPDTFYPRDMRALINDRIDVALGNGWFDATAAARMKADKRVQRETNPSTRISARIPAEPKDILNQAAVAIDQIR